MNLQAIVEGIRELPPAPRVLPALQALSDDDDCSTEDLVTVLKIDAAMTALVVKLANSSFFRGSQPIDNLNEAIQRIGFREVFRSVSLAATSPLLDRKLPAFNMERGELLDESMAAALVAEELDRLLGWGSRERSYTLGLLHAIGKVAIDQFVMKQWSGRVSVSESELDEVRTLDFGLVGSMMLRDWRFPDSISIPVRQQSEPLTAPPRWQKESCMIALARAAIPQVLTSSPSPNDEEREATAPWKRAVEIDDGAYSEAIRFANIRFTQFRELLGFVSP